MKPTKTVFTDKTEERTHSFTFQGSLLQLKVDEPYQPTVPPKRGEITRFTDACRRRMLRYIATIDWEATGKCLFMTLTYPDTHRYDSYKTYSLHRALFWRAIEKHLGRHCAAMWRLEWKQRKTGSRIGEMMPHWHIIVFGCKWISNLVVNDTWKFVIKSYGYVRTEVKGMRNPKQIGYYCAKYSAKVDIVPLSTLHITAPPSGRQWGKLRENLIPRHDIWLLHLPPCKLAHEVIMQASEKQPYLFIHSNLSFTALGELAAELSLMLFGCPLDDWHTNPENQKMR